MMQHAAKNQNTVMHEQQQNHNKTPAFTTKAGTSSDSRSTMASQSNSLVLAW